MLVKGGPDPHLTCLTSRMVWCTWHVMQATSWWPNYVNPYATVCHQVRCIYWVHLGHFHRAIHHLKWYKIVCMRYLDCTFSQMKSINMFSMYLQSGVPRHFLWRFIGVWNRTSLFSCLCMSMLTPNSSHNLQNHGYLGCFHAASARENISGVWGIDTEQRVRVRHRPLHSCDQPLAVLFITIPNSQEMPANIIEGCYVLCDQDFHMRVT